MLHQRLAIGRSLTGFKWGVRSMRSIIAGRHESLTTRTLSLPLREHDPLLYKLICQEKKRQAETISLIASENYIPRYCSEALASCLSSKYSEGLPHSRYYAGNENIDKVEELCQKRALQAFHLNSEDWKVNVQGLSGSPANLAVYMGLLNPQDRILYLDLTHGGHLSHGFEVPGKKLTATSKFFTCMPYKVNKETNLIDYDEIALLAERFRPRLIIAGFSAYPRLLDYKLFKSIAQDCGALLMADIAHIAGLMAGKVIPSAFDHSDIVTTTTHKTLRGPRGALIFCRTELKDSINGGVFPGCQGGPHNHTIGAIASAMKAACDPEFGAYQRQIVKNAQTLGETLVKGKVELLTGGTDNHLLLIDLRPRNLKGAKAEKALELVNLVTNKNTLPYDKSPLNPSGLRIGTPAMTSRGCQEKQTKQIGEILVRAFDEASRVDKQGRMKAKEFAEAFSESAERKELQQMVKDLARSLPTVVSALFD